MNDTEVIKDKIEIVNYVSKRYKSKQVGSSTYAVNPCPLCGHKDCFRIFQKDNSWKCFSCGAGGDLFDFVMETEKIDFKKALELLAKEAGVDLKKGDKKSSKKYDKRKEIEKIFKDAVKYYHAVLLDSPAAMNYLRKKRKRDMRTIKKARYGFADGKLHENLKYDTKLLIASGLVRKKNGKIYDFFSSGVFIYPVYHHRRVVDFFCKDYLAESERRDYQLPNKHKLTNPTFFGKDAIYREEYIITEGPEDRLTILQNYDIPTVSILGQLSSDQIDFIRDHCDDSRIFLAFDNDRAGKKYEKQLINELAGLVTIQKLLWDDGEDIDECLKKQEKPKERIEEMLETAVDAIFHYIQKLPDISNMTPHIAEGHWGPITKWIAAHNNELHRMSYIEALADKLGGKTRFLQPIKNMVLSIRTGGKDEGKQYEEADEYGIISSSGKYYRTDPKKGTKKISEFVLKILAFIEMNDEIYYEVLLTNSKGVRSNNLIFDSKERVNKRQFREKCGSAGSYYFMGNDNDLVEIWQREENLSDIKTRTCYFQRYGFINDHNVWLFKNCAIQGGEIFEPDEGEDVIKIGEIGYLSKNVNIYSGDAPRLNIEFKADDEWLIDVLHKFHVMMDDNPHHGLNSFKGFLIFGLVPAMAYLKEITKFDRKFPYMLIYGPSGTGKSEVMQLIMNCLGFSHGGENWGESTPAGIGMAMEQLSSLPYWLEEYKNVVGTSRRQQKKVEIVNNIYNRSSSGKGGLEFRSAREVNGAIVFTGQDRPEDKAFLSRSVVLDKEEPTNAATDCYFELRAMRDKLSSVLVYLLKNKSKEKSKEIVEYIQEYRERIRQKIADRGYKNKVDERSIYNYCVLAASFSCGYNYHENDTEFIDWLTEQVIEDVKRKSAEDVLYRFFEDIEVLFDDHYDVVKKQAGTLYIAFHQIFHEWKKAGSHMGMAEYMSKNGLLDYMKKDTHNYYIGRDRTYIAGKQQRVIKLMIERLPDNIKQLVVDWEEDAGI